MFKKLFGCLSKKVYVKEYPSVKCQITVSTGEFTMQFSGTTEEEVVSIAESALKLFPIKEE